MFMLGPSCHHGLLCYLHFIKIIIYVFVTDFYKTNFLLRHQACSLAMYQ